MNKITVSLLVLLTMCLHRGVAQSCEYEKNDMDKFSGNATRITKPETIVENFKSKDSQVKLKNISVKAQLKDGVYSLYFTWVMPNTFAGSVPVVMGYGCIITLLLDNKTKIELSSTQPIDDVIMKGSSYYNGRSFTITTGDENKIVGHKVTDIRIKAVVNAIDASLDGDAQLVISKLLACAMRTQKVAVTTGSTNKPENKTEGSLIEDAIRRKKEKKAREEAENKPNTTVPATAAVAKDTIKTAIVPQTPDAVPAKATAPATTAPATAPAQVIPLSGADELMKWKKLLDQGIITKEEFEAQKKKILAN